MIGGVTGAAFLGMRPYSFMFLLGAAFSLALGMFLFRKHPSAKISFLFLVLMVFIFLASVFSFVFVNVADESLATLTAQLLVASIVLAYSCIFLVYSLVAYQERIGRLADHLGPYALASLVLAAIPAFFLAEVQECPWGWGVPVSLSMGLLYTIIGGFILLSVLLLLSFFPMTDSRVKYTSSFATFGIIAPVIVAFPLAFYDIVGYVLGLVVGLLVTAVIFSVGILRYDVFASLLILEEEKPPVEVETDHYSCLLIEGKDTSGAYRTFMDLVSEADQGLLVSRVYPERLRDRYGLEDIRAIWLTDQPGPDRIDPTNLSILQHTILDYLEDKDGPVLLLDGLEYLIANNSLENILVLLYNIRDELTMRGGKAILPVDPDTMDERELSLFERECEVRKEK